MKNKFLIPIIISGLSFSTIFVASLPIYKDNVKEDVRFTEWMKDISDSTKLEDMSIPGSHDSGALYSLADLSGRCQDLNIESQLNIGIRYLDIRLKYEGNENFKIIHGPVDQRISFDDVLSCCSSFLNAHPSETILLSLKDEQELEDGSEFNKALEKVLSDYENQVYKDREIPSNLGASRGKMIILSRFIDNTFGVDCFSGWNINASSTLPNEIKIQDYFKVEDIEKKKEYFTTLLNDTSSSLKLNFLSGYKLSSFPPSYSYSVSKELNPWVIEEVKGKSSLGVIIADSVTTDFTSAIIGGNK
jgi:1-phosphatidylinositol phosphodiesterase